jgi:hypothetical protein
LEDDETRELFKAVRKRVLESSPDDNLNEEYLPACALLPYLVSEQTKGGRATYHVDQRLDLDLDHFQANIKRSFEVLQEALHKSARSQSNFCVAIVENFIWKYLDKLSDEEFSS